VQAIGSRKEHWIARANNFQSVRSRRRLLSALHPTAACRHDPDQKGTRRLILVEIYLIYIVISITYEFVVLF
jgi:hypothetical protein